MYLKCAYEYCGKILNSEHIEPEYVSGARVFTCPVCSCSSAWRAHDSGQDDCRFSAALADITQASQEDGRAPTDPAPAPVGSQCRERTSTISSSYDGSTGNPGGRPHV